MEKLKRITITKRQRFLAASILSLAISIIYPSIQAQTQMFALPILAISIYIISLIAMWENINGVEYITLFILPVSFIIGMNLFLTMLPARKLFLYPTYAAIPLGMYIILLTQNIFNVAVIRTIQLLRAAHAVSYIMTLITAFLLIAYVISLHIETTRWLISIIAIILPLTMQFLWTFDLSEKFTNQSIIYTGIITVSAVQIAFFTQFIPQSIAMTSLFLVAVYYVLLGVFQHYHEKKLTRKPMIEYALVAGTVFIIMIVTTSWQG